ncbi:MAG: glutamate formimidoyltransferase [Dehalococcoidia bacterium]|nr:MAG: glutamate formimidoyltransferase [Dehalococcoidia bacterium]
MRKIIECVPNFSEGRDTSKIEQITAEVEKVPGVKLLDVASDAHHNRTVLTFVGGPESIKKASYNAIARAAEIIDMARHQGQHPRLGACDVCPFVPIQNVTMADCVTVANELAGEVGEKLRIPVFLYEEAARFPERKDLASIRAGQYEGLEAKLRDSRWKPDYGPATFNKKSGATVIGAREFLIAYNVYLSTTHKEIAHRIARIIRESGCMATADDRQRIRIPGIFRSVKAVGISLGESGVAEVSINLTNYRVAPMHFVFEKIKQLSQLGGASVLYSEIVGLIPKEAILETGRFYQPRARSDKKLIEAAVRNLGLDSPQGFNPRGKIIEYLIGAP